MLAVVIAVGLLKIFLLRSQLDSLATQRQLTGGGLLPLSVQHAVDKHETVLHLLTYSVGTINNQTSSRTTVII